MWHDIGDRPNGARSPVEGVEEMLTSQHAVGFLAIWVVAVLLYGLRRSLGEAPADPIRPAGPHPESRDSG